jgi:magnesium-transporting ATPase (P-type)
MGFCHNIVEIDGDVIGDMIDIAMQKKSSFNLSETSFEKLKIFDFDSNLQRMSVVVKNK